MVHTACTCSVPSPCITCKCLILSACVHILWWPLHAHLCSASMPHRVNVCRVLHARARTDKTPSSGCSKLALGTTAPRWLILSCSGVVVCTSTSTHASNHATHRPTSDSRFSPLTSFPTHKQPTNTGVGMRQSKVLSGCHWRALVWRCNAWLRHWSGDQSWINKHRVLPAVRQQIGNYGATACSATIPFFTLSVLLLLLLPLQCGLSDMPTSPGNAAVTA
jgi:hypothetical protein